MTLNNPSNKIILTSVLRRFNRKWRAFPVNCVGKTTDKRKEGRWKEGKNEQRKRKKNGS